MDAKYKDAEGRWFGEILLPEVIMYNNKALTPEQAPKDWDDLLKPEWKDKIIIRDVAASGTMRSIYAVDDHAAVPGRQQPAARLRLAARSSTPTPASTRPTRPTST